MKNTALVILCITMVGCGTMSTVGRDDYSVGSALIKKGSHCNVLPRVYSGVGYNVCKMNSKATDYGTILLGFAVIDAMFSAVLDTLALPYTIYAQNEQGSFDLKEHIR